MNNYIKKYHGITSTCLLITLVLFGCTPSKGPDTGIDIKQPTGEQTVFSPADAKNYADALDNIKNEKPEKAIAPLRKLAEAHANNVGIWINLATAYHQTDKQKEAAQAAAQAIAINEDIPDAHNVAGLIAVDKGEYKNAEKHYLQAIKLNADFAYAHYNLALLYDIYYQDIAKSIPHYERYLTLTGNEDKDTATWVEELKLTLKRRGA